MSTVCSHGPDYWTCTYDALLHHCLQVRGWAIIQWAHHLAPIYRSSPQFQNLQLDTAALAAYHNIDGVPESCLNTLAAPETQQEADHLVHRFLGDRQGYAATRTGSAEEAAIGMVTDQTHHPAQQAWQPGDFVWYHAANQQCSRARIQQVDFVNNRYQVQLSTPPGHVYWTSADCLSAEVGELSDLSI